VTSDGLGSTSDVITFHQNWHHLNSSFSGEKCIFTDAQIRVTGSIEREMCSSEQNFLELEASVVKIDNCRKKIRKEGKAKAEKKNKPKNIKTTVLHSVFVPLDQRSGDKRFVRPACTVSKNVIKRDVSGKQGLLSCC